VETAIRRIKFKIVSGLILTVFLRVKQEVELRFRLKEGSRVRQKHICLVILFIAAIATTCFGRAWPSSGHNVDVYK
jgi:hypothetical protein